MSEVDFSFYCLTPFDQPPPPLSSPLPARPAGGEGGRAKEGGEFKASRLALFVFLVLSLSGAGCATLGQWGIPAPMEPVALEERAVRSLRGQVIAEVIEDGVTRWVFDGGIVVEPGRLRFQTFAPGGWLVGDLLLEGKQGRLYLPSEKTLLVGSPRNLASLVPTIPFARFPPDLLWKTLLGVKGEIARDADEEGGIMVEHEDFRVVNGRRIPWQIAYHLPEEGFTLRLTFRTLEVDSPMTENLFHQDLPPETPVREIPP